MALLITLEDDMPPGDPVPDPTPPQPPPDPPSSGG